ncbi:hypothetical protein F5888DRAFT_1878539 [Russula emetica]|nr:hypothetical protein F5888DRAFT_1878539 [Russula emetica]
MAVDKSLSKQQRVLLLRMRTVLMYLFVESTREVRHVASIEARRLRQIPPHNAEHGVVRNYLEWLTALPWTPPPPGSDTLTHTLEWWHSPPASSPSGLARLSSSCFG